jgi:hypothetical protein
VGEIGRHFFGPVVAGEGHREGHLALEDRTLGSEPVRMSCHKFSESVSFAGVRFPPDVILLAVRWYLLIPVVGSEGIATTGSPVPDGATAIVANVTAVQPSTPGFLSVRPG